MDFPLHGLPPYAAFCTTLRVFVLNESPHVALHSVSDHELHLQSTEIGQYFFEHLVNLIIHTQFIYPGLILRVI